VIHDRGPAKVRLEFPRSHFSGRQLTSPTVLDGRQQLPLQVFEFVGRQASFENAAHLPTGRLLAESADEAEIFQLSQSGLQISLLSHLIPLRRKESLPLIEQIRLINDTPIVARVLFLKTS
jgi:hypothetical protein